jgi:hypothetical protein
MSLARTQSYVSVGILERSTADWQYVRPAIVGSTSRLSQPSIGSGPHPKFNRLAGDSLGIVAPTPLAEMDLFEVLVVC